MSSSYSYFHSPYAVLPFSYSTVNRIKTETGTSIIIPPDDEHSDVIRIEGDPKGVVAAKTLLLELAAKMVSCMQAAMELGPEDVSLLERCPHFRGCYVQASMELGPEDVSLLERCPHFRGCYVLASMELGPEDVSLLERCPHFRGCYVQASMEMGPEHRSLLGWVLCTGFNGVGT